MQNLKEFVSEQRLRLLCAQSPAALLTALLAAGVLVFMLHGVVAPRRLAIWLALLIAVTLGRMLLLWHWRRREPWEAGRCYMLLGLLAFASGTLWGGGALMFLLQAPLQYQLFIILMVGGMVTGAAAAYAASFPVYIAFSLPALFPETVWFLLQADGIHVATGLMMLLFFVAMGFIVHRNRAMLFTGLKHEYRNLQLARELKQEIRHRRQEQALLSSQSQVLERIARGERLGTVLETLVRRIETHCKGMKCSVLLLDHEGKHLLHGAAPSLPQEWNEAVNGFEIGPVAGSCGTAAYRKTRVVSADIATDPLWAPFREPALRLDLRACWSQPILSSKKVVLGTFAMYYHEPRRPTEYEIRVIETAADLAAVAIVHDRKTETLNQLVRVMPDGIVIHVHGRFVYANPAAATMLGAREPEDLIGRSILEFIHPDFHSTVLKRIRRATRVPVPAMEEKLLRMDGGEFEAEVTALPIRYGGEPAIEVIIHDLSARRRAEEEADRLRTAVEHVEESIYLTDRKGRVMYANAAAGKLYGLPPAEMRGRYVAELRGGRPGDAMYRRIVTAMREGRTWKGEIVLRRSDGDRRVVLHTVSPAPGTNGDPPFHVCIDHDVTEAKRQRARIEHSQRLESLGVLAGGIAHDFNNILMAIMGNAELGRMELPDAHPALAYLERIEQSSARAAELCRQMLAYSGRGKFVVKSVNLSSLVREITKLLSVGIGKNVTLRLDLDENIPPVQADTAQLQQVVMNLVLNASEAIGKEEGTVSISTGTMVASEADLEDAYAADSIAPGDFVYLQVRDDGCGMDVETRRKIFDPFFTTKFTGRGLGMSAVLGIVRGHGGAIKVSSKVGRGSTFNVMFPAALETSSMQEESEMGQDWKGSGTVLVVDDEETVRKMAALMLGHMGFETITAADGMEAVDVYKRKRGKIVVVLLDMTMPRMDGRACFEALRCIDREVRVILSSGYSEQEAVNRFASRGPAAFLQKPYTLAALRATMRDVLSASTAQATP